MILSDFQTIKDLRFVLNEALFPSKTAADQLHLEFVLILRKDVVLNLRLQSAYLQAKTVLSQKLKFLTLTTSLMSIIQSLLDQVKLSGTNLTAMNILS